MKNKGVVFKNLDSFIIVTTFLFLWFAINFGDTTEDMVAYFLILTFGILHGANDLKLIQTSNSKAKKKYNFLKVASYYILFILFCASLFYYLPSLALFTFVLFSGYHFGEQHWNSKLKSQSRTTILFYSSYGLFVLSLLFVSQVTVVNSVIENITGYAVPIRFYTYLLFLSGGLFIALYILLTKNHKLISSWVKEIFYLVLFLIVFKTASLLWSFAIYFILWHSLPSLVDQIRFLYGDVTKKSIILYLKTSFVYWAISVTGLALLYLFIGKDSDTFEPIFFSFLAAITFPHVLVMIRLYK
ncbi:beta-carotene dioxygenase [Sediminicola sp. YIK13]|uniref:Brp/Blh family beta-carotene 15,15'-dioxygenase n=1 Tax=Sediminicola sp. YIK13 TaxID=1453352 RepID=UPI0007222070|nr:Brp/Blh family beta-carotene 15,15'-dioxygenase [Sediminicola sp. YIK13]ALM07846.1 beta-carotene dioxygenase [Sediminicola sp. YIK13]